MGRVRGTRRIFSRSLQKEDGNVNNDKNKNDLTEAPTHNPTQKPTEAPTQKPTKQPTKQPTQQPTQRPTSSPTKRPTETPTSSPTSTPTSAPVSSISTPTTSPPKMPTTLTSKPSYDANGEFSTFGLPHKFNDQLSLLFSVYAPGVPYTSLESFLSEASTAFLCARPNLWLISSFENVINTCPYQRRGLEFLLDVNTSMRSLEEAKTFDSSITMLWNSPMMTSKKYTVEDVQFYQWNLTFPVVQWGEGAEDKIQMQSAFDQAITLKRLDAVFPWEGTEASIIGLESSTFLPLLGIETFDSSIPHSTALTLRVIGYIMLLSNALFVIFAARQSNAKKRRNVIETESGLLRTHEGVDAMLQTTRELVIPQKITGLNHDDGISLQNDKEERLLQKVQGHLSVDTRTAQPLLLMKDDYGSDGEDSGDEEDPLSFGLSSNDRIAVSSQVDLFCGAFSEICCINLRRREDRWKLFQDSLYKTLGETAAPVMDMIRRFDAVDGQALFDLASNNSDTQFLDSVAIEWNASQNAMYDRRIKPPMTKRLTPGEVGCVLSHVNLWKELAKSQNHENSRFLILEDDAVFYDGSDKNNSNSRTTKKTFLQAFSRSWEAVPADWDILYLGFCNVGKRQEVASTSRGYCSPATSVDVDIFRPTYGFFTHAYAISRSAAKFLLNKLPVVGPLDVWLADNAWFGLNVYCVAVANEGVRGRGASLISQRQEDSDIAHSAHVL